MAQLKLNPVTVLPLLHKQVAPSEDVMAESTRVGSKTEDVRRPTTTEKPRQQRMVAPA